MKIFLLVITIGCFACLASAVEYFPPGYFNASDVTPITWAHAVNSKALLEQNLGDDSIQFLEADIVMGVLIGGNGTIQPIMAHPPAILSDLSFDMFLNATVEHNRNLPLQQRKGMKLDFKVYVAAERSLPILGEMNRTNPELLHFPVWINADILPGPVNSTGAGVNGTNLIQLQKEFLPQSTLSLGWTTRYEDNGTYTLEHVTDMASIIKTQFETPDEQTNAQVTFPLRAAIAINSIDNINHLLDEAGIEFSSPSVTLWEGSSDPLVTSSELEAFIQAVNKSRVFLDLPYSLGPQLRLKPGDTSASGSLSKSWVGGIILMVLVWLTG